MTITMDWRTSLTPFLSTRPNRLIKMGMVLATMEMHFRWIQPSRPIQTAMESAITLTPFHLI
jgi:hypothetical protein